MLVKKLSFLQRYFIICLALNLIIVALMAYGYFYYGVSGQGRLQELNDVSTRLNNLEKIIDKNKNEILAIDTSAEDAVRNFEAVKQDINFLSAFMEEKEKSILKQSLLQTEQSFSEILAQPKFDQLSNVFKDKLNDFSVYVEKNQWPTLSRIALRIIKRHEGINSRSTDLLQNAITSIRAEFSQIEAVTTSSVLDENIKQEILSKVTNLKIELDMFEKYGTALKKLRQTTTQFLKDLKAGVAPIEPVIIENKFKLKESSHNFLVYLFALVVLLFVEICIGHLLGRWVEKKVNLDFEHKFLEILTQMTHGKHVNVEGGSKNFNSELVKIADYIFKRINVGYHFQQSLPFATFILNKNLKIDWGNNYFFELIGKRENTIGSSNDMSWDLIQSFTNIGDNDPVYDAFEKRLSGIYQVMVMDVEQKQQIPFEMYVCPVEMEGDFKIVIYMYPLINFEQSISEQAKTLISPVNKTLNALLNQSWEELESEKLQKEFELGNIQNIGEKFKLLRDNVRDSFYNYQKEIKSLECEIQDLIKVILDLRTINSENIQNMTEIMGVLRSFRDVIIRLVDLQGKSSKVLVKLNHHFQNQSGLGSELSQVIQTKDKSITHYQKTIDGILEHKTELKELRSKVLKELAPTIAGLKRLITNADQRTRTKVDEAEFGVSKIEEEIRKLEVLVSKAEIQKNDYLVESQNLDPQSSVKKFKDNYELIQNTYYNSLSAVEESGRLNEDLVSLLEGLGTNFKKVFDRAKLIESQTQMESSMSIEHRPDNFS